MVAVNVQAHTAVESMRHPAPIMGVGKESNAFARINELIMLMKKLNIEMRDTLRGFHDDMQKVAFDKQVVSMETKLNAIEKTYIAARGAGIAQIVSGAVSGLSAGIGSYSPLISSVAPSAGKVGEGIASTYLAGITRDAQQLQLEGEFQATLADNLTKTLATIAERAAEASRQMREATRELLALYGQLANAVQLRAR